MCFAKISHKEFRDRMQLKEKRCIEKYILWIEREWIRKGKLIVS